MISPVSAAFNSTAANATTVTLGTISDGTIVYVAAQTGGAGAAALTPPAGWATINTGTHGDGSRFGLFRIAASSLPTTAAFTSSDATFVTAIAWWFSGANTTTPEDATTTRDTGAGPSNPTVPSITSVTDNSLHLIINANRTSQFGGGAIPAGYTALTGDGVGIRACYKVITPAATVSGLSIAESKSNWATWSVMVKEAAAGPNITSVSTATPREGASLTITGTAFGASQGGGSVTINGVAQTVTSWSDTSVAVTVVLGTNKFGAAYNVILTDSSAVPSNTYAGITGLLPANSGLSSIDVGTPHADPDLRLESSADAVSGDQVEWENKGLLVDVFANLTFTAGPGVNDFRWRLWTSGSGYGPWVTQRTGGASGAQRLAMSLAIGL